MVLFTVFNVARLLLSKKEQHTEMSGTGVLRECVWLMWQGATTRVECSVVDVSLAKGIC